MVNYTYKDVIASLSEKLAAAGITNYYWEARELAGFALGFNCRGKFDQTAKATGEQINNVALLLARRLMGEPLQYIIGEWDFYGEPFEVGAGALIPRADTETLINAAKKLFEGKAALVVADLCAGTGCIGITLERELDCKEVYCVEKYETAMYFLKRNISAKRSGCRAILADVKDAETTKLLPQADLIVCNPPYVTDEEMTKLQKEVTFEPEEALRGGEDGLDFYRAIVREWKYKLKDDGIMLFEIGAGQEDEVMEIMIQAGFKDVRTRSDMAGINRCVFGKNHEYEAVSLYEQLDNKNNERTAD